VRLDSGVTFHYLQSMMPNLKSPSYLHDNCIVMFVLWLVWVIVVLLSESCPSVLEQTPILSLTLRLKFNCCALKSLSIKIHRVLQNVNMQHCVLNVAEIHKTLYFKREMHCDNVLFVTRFYWLNCVQKFINNLTLPYTEWRTKNRPAVS